MRKTKNFNIAVPELGDKPDITQVSNAIEDLEDALAGTVEVFNASVQGETITLKSGSRTTNRTRYYDGMSLRFTSPVEIQANTVKTVVVDQLSEQKVELDFYVDVGDCVDLVYEKDRFVAMRHSALVPMTLDEINKLLGFEPIKQEFILAELQDISNMHPDMIDKNGVFNLGHIATDETKIVNLMLLSKYNDYLQERFKALENIFVFLSPSELEELLKQYKK